MSIRPHGVPPEEAYLECEAELAKGAMRSSLIALRRAANPLALMRGHPVAAGALIGGAAAAAAARLARGPRHDAETATAECAVRPAEKSKHGIVHDVRRAIRTGLISLLVSKVLLV
jgi:hypothetical protein